MGQSTQIKMGLSVLEDAYLAGVQAARDARIEGVVDLIIVFGSIHYQQSELLAGVKSILKADKLIGCSAYALLSSRGVLRQGVMVLCLNIPGFDARVESYTLCENESELGRKIIDSVQIQSGLNLALLFRGYGAGEDEGFLSVLRKELPNLALFGGLSCGDYDLGMSHENFWKSYQYYQDDVKENSVTLAHCQFDEQQWELSFGFSHGWNPITEEIEITKSDGMHVYEVDGLPIFDFYRQFLGDRQERDFFELMIQRYGFALELDYRGEKRNVVKLPVSCDFEKGCITFAPYHDYQNQKVRMLQANRPHVIEGARRAATRALEALNGLKPAMALVISCCSRAHFLHSRLEAELEAIEEVLGKDCLIAGYYSGGEIAPFLNRFVEVCDEQNPLFSSYYHAGTITVLLIAHKELRINTNPGSLNLREGARPDVQRLLSESEAILDDTQIFMSSLSYQSIKNAEQLRDQNLQLKIQDEQNQKLQEVVHRYTPHRVFQKAGESVHQGRYEIVEEEVFRSFLFMDVKGFTSYSEKHGSEEVIMRLNEIFDPATQCIYEHKGDVDKFIGDCIFAVFDVAQDGVDCALEILQIFEKLKENQNPFSVRMGLHTGRAIHGNVGSIDRREYTYIGDAVNVAQRLESQCESMGLLISSDVYSSLNSKTQSMNWSLRELSLKGKQGSFQCYQFLA